MAFYSDETIKTEILEPVVHVSNNRSEFRIKGNSVLSNLRLANIQLLDADGTANSNDVLGMFACIRNLYLYDGRNVLCSARDFNRHQAFKTFLDSNAENYAINRNNISNNIGYTSTIVNPSINIIGGTNNGKSNKEFFGRRTQVKNEFVDALVTGATIATLSTAALLNLKDVFGFLNRIPLLSPKVFKNGLRLVVEYSKSSSEVCNMNNRPEAKLSQRSPVLIIDRIESKEVENALLSQMGNFEYNEVENDRFLVAATTAGTTTPTEQTLKGFSGKTVERLRLNKNYAAIGNYFGADNTLTDKKGIFGSLAGFQEKYQIILNGRPVAPEQDGFKGKNRGLALITDTYGSLNVLENGQFNVSAIYEQNHALLGRAADGSLNKKISGKESFFGVYLGQKVNNLKVQYSRTGKTDGSPDSKYNSQLEVLVEAEIKKAFVMQNGQYQIVYV